MEPLQDDDMELSRVQFSRFLQIPSAGGGESLKASDRVSIEYDEGQRLVIVVAQSSDGVVSRRLVPLENVVMMELSEDARVSEDQRLEIKKQEDSARKPEKTSKKGGPEGSGDGSASARSGRRGRPKTKG